MAFNQATGFARSIGRLRNRLMGARSVGGPPMAGGGLNPYTQYKKDVETQYAAAKAKLPAAKEEASRSALENAQRVAAIRGTTGAGFETTLQRQGQESVDRTFIDAERDLEAQKSGALMQGAQLGETARQFDATLGLQSWIAKNEMDMSRMATFINSATALKEAGLRNPNDWGGLWKSLGLMGIRQGLGFTGPNPQLNYNAEKHG